jgi:hypothetical protein
MSRKDGRSGDVQKRQKNKEKKGPIRNRTSNRFADIYAVNTEMITALRYLGMGTLPI